MSAPPLGNPVLYSDVDDEESEEEVSNQFNNTMELVQRVDATKSPQVCARVEIGRKQEIEDLKALASNKISDQISLIVDRFERERYLLLQRYQDRLADIHQRETSALKDFVNGITFNSAKQTRTDILDKISKYYMKIRSITNL